MTPQPSYPPSAPAVRSGGLARVLKIVGTVETTVAILALAVMTIVVFADVFGRDLLGHGIAGAQRIGVYAFVVAGFLGLPLATAQGMHLRPKFADRIFPAKAEMLAVHVQNALAAALSLGLAWFGFSFARQTMALNEVSPVLEVPVGWVQMVLPYAFASSGLRHIVFALRPDLAPLETGDPT